MSVDAAQVASDPLQSTVARIVLAGALGLFLGLERAREDDTHDVTVQGH